MCTQAADAPFCLAPKRERVVEVFFAVSGFDGQGGELAQVDGGSASAQLRKLNGSNSASAPR